MKAHDNDCTSLLDLCRHGNGFSLMEEDQACAMDRDPGKFPFNDSIRSYHFMIVYVNYHLMIVYAPRIFP